LKLIDDQNGKHHNAVSITQHIRVFRFSGYFKNIAKHFFCSFVQMNIAFLPPYLLSHSCKTTLVSQILTLESPAQA